MPAAPAKKARSDPRDTPAMRQYARFKAEHPDCVLFFRMGDFYEMFDDDAVLAHRALSITLTERTAGVPMAGVPYHAVETYLRRMIEQGYRVAVCEQVQDPREAKGVVDRAVTRVLTPGTLVDADLLDDAVANQVAAVHFPDGPEHAAVIAAAELSTGSFTLIDAEADRLLDEVTRLAPSEILYEERHDGTTPEPVQRLREAVGCPLTSRPGWNFRQTDARDLVQTHFGVTQVAGFGLDDDDPALGAAGALLRYLLETQAGEGDGSTRLAHLQPPRRQHSGNYVSIDAASLRSLEIERTLRSGQYDGSLLSIFQRCATSMGKRRLRQWLCFPLRERAAVEERQRAVAGLVDDRAMGESLRTQFNKIQDVARIVGRICVRRATPRDLVALGTSVGTVRGLVDVIEGHPAFTPYHERLAAVVDVLQPLAETIVARCQESPPPHTREGGIFKDGVDGELDEARGLQRDASSWLAKYQQELTEATAIPSLKVGYNKVFGYYIEVTHAHTDKVPVTFSRKQTLKNAERYITEQLKEFEDKVTTADTRAIEREKQLFEALCAEAAGRGRELSEFADAVADLDVLACFAEMAIANRYARPTLVDEPTLEIVQGRHPVLDRTLGDGFVPNDCRIGRDEETKRRRDEVKSGTLAIITGPNMAGKSTYIRQVALITLLAHTGSFVPAESATIGMTDRIFTRIGAADEIHAGHSTFMVEMTETANILHHATGRSLVILDEIGRGTSTLDGLSLAWAIAESIADRGCRTLFATHYHELTSLAERLPNVTNLHVSVREWGDEVIFLYRILPGRTDRSYGIHVAKIAGVPAATIDRANQLLETLAVQTEPHEIPPAATDPKPDEQMSLFREYLPHPAVDTIRGLDLNSMTPLEALAKLEDLQDGLDAV